MRKRNMDSLIENQLEALSLLISQNFNPREGYDRAVPEVRAEIREKVEWLKQYRSRGTTAELNGQIESMIEYAQQFYDRPR